jgi:hypothetical protein
MISEELARRFRRRTRGTRDRWLLFCREYLAVLDEEISAQTALDRCSCFTSPDGKNVTVRFGRAKAASWRKYDALPRMVRAAINSEEALEDPNVMRTTVAALIEALEATHVSLSHG